MPHTPREPSRSPPAAPSVLRSSLIALCAMAQATWPLATNAAETQAMRTQPQRPLILNAGTQQELLIDRGIERMAIADEAVAAVTVTRKTPSSPAARLIITGKTAGRTTLMVWEKGSAAATTYAIEVQRRSSTLAGTMDSVTTHQQARDTAMASSGDKVELIDRSIVNVRSNTVQVEVKVVEFNRSVLKQAGLNIFSTRANSNGFSFGSFTPSSLKTATFASDGSISGEYSNPLAQAFSLLQAVRTMTLLTLTGPLTGC